MIAREIDVCVWEVAHAQDQGRTLATLVAGIQVGELQRPLVHYPLRTVSGMKEDFKALHAPSSQGLGRSICRYSA